MKHYCSSIFALALLASVPLRALEEPVKIETGLVSGTADGSEGVRAFKGIPFAPPPVGELRWKPPQPAKPWQGVRACAEFGPWCPQPKSAVGFPGGTSFSEDCLSLNIWTAAKTANDKLPVMFWIHGGGCTTGSGASIGYDGTALARQGVVLVTINYRLGPFGYLAHPLLSKESAQGVSGNYGHLDQIAALQWVQRNIAAFGGDPGCVTIFGESAGAMSVCRLMVSPLAKGLFHRAIAQSGGAHGRNAHLREGRLLMEPAEKIGERIAATLGCDKADNPLAAMRAVSADELLKASNPAQGLFGKGVKFGPVVDGWAIPEDPGDMFTAGKQHAVPFLAGSNADEGNLFLQQMPVQHAAGYRAFVQAFFGAHGAEALKLMPCASDADLRPAFNRLTTVASFAAPARILVKSMSEQKMPAYLYQFTRVSPTTKRLGMNATHAMEIPYVFGTLRAGPGYTETDHALARAMQAYWVQFAKTGDPNAPGLPPWPRYDPKTNEHLELGDQVKPGRDLFKAECDLLEQAMTERGGRKR